MTPRDALSRIPVEVPVRVVYCRKNGQWVHSDRVGRDVRTSTHGLWGDAYQGARYYLRTAFMRMIRGEGTWTQGAIVLVHPDSSLRAVEAVDFEVQRVPWTGDPEWCWTATAIVGVPR